MFRWWWIGRSTEQNMNMKFMWTTLWSENRFYCCQWVFTHKHIQILDLCCLCCCILHPMTRLTINERTFLGYNFDCSLWYLLISMKIRRKSPKPLFFSIRWFMCLWNAQSCLLLHASIVKNNSLCRDFRNRPIATSILLSCLTEMSNSPVHYEWLSARIFAKFIIIAALNDLSLTRNIRKLLELIFITNFRELIFYRL